MEITETTILDLSVSNKSEEPVLITSDMQIELVVKALSSKTRRKILTSIQEEPADVSRIAKILNMTEANISAQIKKLEKAELITCDYRSGQHGVRKISRIRYNKIIIKF